jgi:hypothetical protein
MTAFETGLYELLLRFPNGVEEVRLTDQLDSFYSREGFLEFHGRSWAVVGNRCAAASQALARLICQPVDPATCAAPVNRSEAPQQRSARVSQTALEANKEGMVDDLQAAPLHRYRCASCGYGATRQAEPEQCPMCHRSEWNKEGWSPFTAALGDLDPTAARLAREMQ